MSLLDDLRIDYYGVSTPLNQVGTMAVPEPRLITIQPWEKNLIPEIEKADSPVGPWLEPLIRRSTDPPGFPAFD